MRIPRLGLALVISAMGKVLGFVRLQMLVILLGTTAATDTLLLALTVLSFFDAVFVSGGAILVAQSAYARSLEAGTARFATQRLVLSCATWSMVAILFGTICAFAGDWIALGLAPGFSEESRLFFSKLLVTGAALPVAATLMVYASTVNRMHGREALYASNQIVTNGAVIAALGLATAAPIIQHETAILVVIVTVVATLGMAGVQLAKGRPNLDQRGIEGALKMWATVSVKRIARIGSRELVKTLPIVLAIILQHACSLISLSFASRSGPGSLTVLGVSDRLVNVVLMLTAATFLTVLEPRWARQSANSGAARTVRSDIRFIVLLLLPPTAALGAAGESIGHLLFGLGRVDMIDLEKMGLVLSVSALGLPFAAYSLLASRALIIAGSLRGIAGVAALAVAAHFALCTLFEPSLGVLGVAIASGTSQAIQAVAIAVLARRHLSTDDTLRSNLRAAVVMISTAIPAGLLSLVTLPHALRAPAIFVCAVIGFLGGCVIAKEPVMESARRLYRL